MPGKNRRSARCERRLELGRQGAAREMVGGTHRPPGNRRFHRREGRVRIPLRPTLQDNRKVHVAGPFTVESLSPHRILGVDEDDELLDTLRETGRGVRQRPSRSSSRSWRTCARPASNRRTRKTASSSPRSSRGPASSSARKVATRRRRRRPGEARCGLHRTRVRYGVVLIW